MAKISNQTKEIINIILFLLVVGILVTFYWIYPLSLAKTGMGRNDLNEYSDRLDTLSELPNEALLWEEAGLKPDTFRVEADGLTTLACLRLQPEDSAIGTVFLLHNDNQNRDSILWLASVFLQSGYVVLAYDQRASGRSTGLNRGGGQYESSDLNELIANIDLRYGIEHPLIAVGFGTGADAVILSSQSESRLDAIVAIEPYLSSTRLLDKLKEQHDMLWFPFFRSVVWWWYEMRSSYAVEYREISDIVSAEIPTLLFVPEEDLEDEEVRMILTISKEAERLMIKKTPTDRKKLEQMLLNFTKNQPAESPTL
ncbi:MAG: hypothetical protein IID63_08475 [candidate division Zixibacteria bacterium]|nr:hypothetical protein [candidate division Zixibacteria bacterium]